MAARRQIGHRYVTKPGRHGTLYLFAITYTSPRDPGFGRDTVRRWAYDHEHAHDRFLEEDEDGWWEILSIEKVRDRS